jgi:hypothetical protein
MILYKEEEEEEEEEKALITAIIAIARSQRYRVSGRIEVLQESRRVSSSFGRSRAATQHGATK